jgi:hypothetical protein
MREHIAGIDFIPATASCTPGKVDVLQSGRIEIFFIRLLQAPAPQYCSGPGLWPQASETFVM